jgi:hypothetical protein
MSSHANFSLFDAMSLKLVVYLQKWMNIYYEKKMTRTEVYLLIGEK